MDWKLIIADLRATGMSQGDIGLAIGKSQGWVADVVRGRYDDLKWGDGEALRKLHTQTCIPKLPQGRPLIDHSTAKAA